MFSRRSTLSEIRDSADTQPENNRETVQRTVKKLVSPTSRTGLFTLFHFTQDYTYEMEAGVLKYEDRNRTPHQISTLKI